ncbi:MAG: inorganic pyrophosphatase [Candidatus Manganitrophus sp.]|nr:inorganic pyrophosphatase [Candidatus Manganitrophus sp.]WDT72039.1 MAG: inorganic pyrophosphatase [Candidatus Manganitrophus sp.]WDT75722.1 MAG: inorganic pyrophosphatase [Candidatus Manganitrophus sp.]WDT80556.1 MAG: inorganic pyrophosphatase [Candidatus Manganitrophus sp.]
MSFPSPFYRWRPHPWHGLEVGPNPPSLVHAYIEITPFDTVKYELDKVTGYLHVDRPQRSSALPPSLYGFVPRTYCGRRVGALMRNAKIGDRDPLDICVLSERPIDRSDVILQARVVGGLPMLDDGEADDKIIAVIKNDHLWSDVKDISELPSVLVERLRHYFSTYKLVPGESSHVVIDAAYNREHAERVIKAAMEDYQDEYGS